MIKMAEKSFCNNTVFFLADIKLNYLKKYFRKVICSLPNSDFLFLYEKR